MTLVAMAIYDTEENRRSEITQASVESLLNQAGEHSVYLVDNGSCTHTKDYLQRIESKITKLITLPENIGTARAINEAWKYRQPGENCVKMDNDVVINSNTWIQEMEAAIYSDAQIGIIGLKRKDCWENPYHENPHFRSTLMMINKPGTKWQIVEKVLHVIGTCQMYSSALLDKIGYLYQIGLYGYDDVIASHKSIHAGYFNCFLPHIDIDHIDPGNTPYQSWKERASGEVREQVENYLRNLNKDNLYQGIY